MVDDVRSRTRSSCQANNPNGEKDQTIDSPSKGGPSRWIQRAYQGTITVIEFTVHTSQILILNTIWDQLHNENPVSGLNIANKDPERIKLASSTPNSLLFTCEEGVMRST